ncbi:MAG TPA: hypothetical protein VFC63_22795 [Blastocatellia bacterium]|nr:hypothetical protein [Blastocatellia bacterium]
MKLKRRKALTAGTEWSSAEEKKLLNYLRTRKYNADALRRLFPRRELPSIRSKVRKMRIAHDLFGSNYRKTKEAFTSSIGELASPHSVFEAYAGAGHQTVIWAEKASIVFASEKLSKKREQFCKRMERAGYKKTSTKNKWVAFRKGRKKVMLYQGDAVEAATSISARGHRVDLIDLDTCGSTLPTVPIFLTLLKPKHLVITHGEFHSMRFMREDVLRRTLPHRDIDKTPFPLTVDKMAKELDKAVKVYALRSHNETGNSFWADLKNEQWLGKKSQGMLRRHYVITKPAATADCLNHLASA